MKRTRVLLQHRQPERSERMFDILLTLTAVARRLGVPPVLLCDLEPMRPASRGEEALYDLAEARRHLRDRGIALRPDDDPELMPLAAIAHHPNVPEFLLRGMPPAGPAGLTGQPLYRLADARAYLRREGVILVDGEPVLVR
jgi:hypothetical protein